MAESLLQCQGHPFGEESFGQNIKPLAKNLKQTSFTAQGGMPQASLWGRFANPYASWEKGLSEGFLPQRDALGMENEYTNSKGILWIGMGKKLIFRILPMNKSRKYNIK